MVHLNGVLDKNSVGGVMGNILSKIYSEYKSKLLDFLLIISKD